MRFYQKKCETKAILGFLVKKIEGWGVLFWQSDILKLFIMT